VFALRFQAYGRRRYVTLGTPEDGWTRRRGEQEMDVVRAEVDRGAWISPPPRRRARVGGEDEGSQLFGSFASAQVRRRRAEVQPATSAFWGWASDICCRSSPTGRCRRSTSGRSTHTASTSSRSPRTAAVGHPRTDSLGRPLRPLSPASINKTIEVLSWLLSFAVEYGWIDDNPAAGRRRRISVERSPAPHLESAGQVTAVLEAAAELDADPGWQIDDRLPVVATLLLAGLRVHEIGALRWGDLDFVTSTVHVRRSKTPAGIREVEKLPALKGHLLRHRSRRGPVGGTDLVFPTLRGGPRTKDNIRLRILRPVLARARVLLDERGEASLPAGISPHSLRHTFASLLFAIGEDPVSVMRQLGHTDPAFTLRVYAHTMSRGSHERERLRAIAEGREVVGEAALGLERDRRNSAYRAEWVVSTFEPTSACVDSRRSAVRNRS
jgi:integrase